MIVNVRPAIVIVPFRGLWVFGVTLKLTLLVPLPVTPDVILIHDSVVVDVQGHPFPDVTSTEPVPPAAGMETLVGLIS